MNDKIEIPQQDELIDFVSKNKLTLSKSTKKFNIKLKDIRILLRDSKYDELIDSVNDARSDLKEILKNIPNCENAKEFIRSYNKFVLQCEDLKAKPHLRDEDGKSLAVVYLTAIHTYLELCIIDFSNSNMELLLKPYQLTKELINMKKIGIILTFINGLLTILNTINFFK